MLALGRSLHVCYVCYDFLFFCCFFSSLKLDQTFLLYPLHLMIGNGTAWKTSFIWIWLMV